MKGKFTWFPDYSNWCEGEVDGVQFQAKLFDEPSVFGINEGRVSKLSIPGASYDRGWDYREDNAKVSNVVEFLENAPFRFKGKEEKSYSMDEYRDLLRRDGKL
ncbi:hypothetical protein NST63_24270 [Heyndrickxia sp. FSL W8-0496]|uniref:DUF7678 domain-containing protein n=1 Tax=Heyndrickxia sp. FSL W8-0496 TaxID=2954702 RepID=UPI0030F93122